MTREDLTRLVHEEPEFARLVAASNKEAPPSDQFEKALLLATEIAATPRRISWGWLAPNLAIGLAVIGATVLGVLAGTRALRSGDTVTPPAAVALAAPQPCAAPCAPDRAGNERPPTTNEEAASVVTVSVNDLAPVPSATTTTSTRPPPTKAAPATAASSASAAAPFEHAEPPPSLPEPSGVARTTFVEELALVGTARSTLERGDIPSCMRAVARYQERFGSGTFAQEIEVIRIEALFASRERTRARIAAEQFLAAHAKSPYADRVRSLLERNSH